MRRAAIVSAVVLGMGAAACASILGIEDGKLDPNAAADGGIELCTADGGLPADPSQVFVAAEVGVDGPGCGNQAAPCKTIAAGLGALGPGQTVIYLATSRHQTTDPTTKFNESFSLPSNVELQGGWSVRGSAQAGYEWQAICQDQLSNADQIANIVGVDNTTIRVGDIQGEAKLTNLYVGTRGAKPGESLIAIAASGSQTVVTLTRVIVDAAKGGDGAQGMAGAAGDDAPDGSCTVGDGSTPAVGSVGSPSGPSAYDVNGVHSGSGTAGGPGGPGSNGPLPEDGGCLVFAKCAIGSFLCSEANGTSCGAPGNVGCGGGPGHGGGPGQSGGSSVGIFVSGGATVNVTVGAVKARGGGNGGTGGAGGPGGMGSTGAAGADNAAIHPTCADCNNNMTKAPKGGAGSTGGDGSSGGQGGGGAAGDSFAFYNLDASVTSDASLDHASAGKAADPGGAGGTAKDFGP